jgi:glucose-1-phosphate adenylyltransferase
MLNINLGNDERKTLALVLAGGRGERLKKLTDWRVKPAVPFGGKYRIIDFTLSNCLNSNIRKIGILTQYKSQSLTRHIIRGWDVFHTELDEFIECVPAQNKSGSDWYLGTANAIYQNIDLIHYHKPKYILILSGDHIYKMDYGDILSFHKVNDADLTIATTYIPLQEASRYGILETDQHHRIKSFYEKPSEPVPSPTNPGNALASMGIYLFNTDFLLSYLYEDARNRHSTHDFGKDLIPKLIKKERVFAFPFFDFDKNMPHYWKDVGTVDSYWKANMDLIGVSPELNLYDLEWPIRTAGSNYPPAKFIFNEPNRQGKAIDSIVAEGCIISGATIEHSMLFNNVRVQDHTYIKNSIILPNVTIGKNCRINNTIVDKECKIPDDTIIGEDLSKDAQRFDISPEGIRLVEPEMLGQSIQQIE